MTVPNHTSISQAIIAQGHVKPDPIFYTNVLADLVSLIGGFLLSIPSIILSIYNGMVLGTITGADPSFGLVGLIPHGIFEYLAGAFSLTGAFIITKLEINVLRALFDKEKSVKEVLTSKEQYKDLIFLIICIIIFLFKAALFETQIDCLLTNAFYNI